MQDLKAAEKAVVLNICIGTKRRITKHFILKIKHLQMFVEFLWTDTRSRTWNLALTFFPENDTEHSAQRQAISAFQRLYDMGDVPVHGAVPEAEGQSLHSSLMRQPTVFAEGIEEVKAFRTRGNFFLNARSNKLSKRMANWRAAVASFADALELLKAYRADLDFDLASGYPVDDEELYDGQHLMLVAESSRARAERPDDDITDREIEGLRRRVLAALEDHMLPDDTLAVAYQNLCAIELRLGEEYRAHRAIIMAACFLPSDRQIRRMKREVFKLLSTPKEPEDERENERYVEPLLVTDGSDLRHSVNETGRELDAVDVELEAPDEELELVAGESDESEFMHANLQDFMA